MSALAELPSDTEMAPPPVEYAEPAHPLIWVTLSARGAALAEGIADLGNHLAQLPGGGVPLSALELAYYSRLLAGFGATAIVRGPKHCA